MRSKCISLIARSRQICSSTIHRFNSFTLRAADREQEEGKNNDEQVFKCLIASQTGVFALKSNELTDCLSECYCAQYPNESELLSRFANCDSIGELRMRWSAECWRGRTIALLSRSNHQSRRAATASRTLDNNYSWPFGAQRCAHRAEKFETNNTELCTRGNSIDQTFRIQLNFRAICAQNRTCARESIRGAGIEEGACIKINEATAKAKQIPFRFGFHLSALDFKFDRKEIDGKKRVRI